MYDEYIDVNVECVCVGFSKLMFTNIYKQINTNQKKHTDITTLILGTDSPSPWTSSFFCYPSVNTRKYRKEESETH